MFLYALSPMQLPNWLIRDEFSTRIPRQYFNKYLTSNTLSDTKMFSTYDFGVKTKFI